MKKNLPARNKAMGKEQTSKNKKKVEQFQGFNKQHFKQVTQPTSVKYCMQECQEYQSKILEDFMSNIVRQSLIYMRARQGTQLEDQDVKATLRLFGAKGNL